MLDQTTIIEIVALFLVATTTVSILFLRMGFSLGGYMRDQEYERDTDTNLE